MINTCSQFSRRASRPFSRQSFLDRLLDENLPNQGSQNRLTSLDEVFESLARRSGKNTAAAEILAREVNQ